MKKWKVYEYSGCSTCRKALKFLDGKKVAYEKIDITTQPPTTGELKKMLEAVGGEVRKLFNTSGQVYKELELSKNLPGMGVKDALALLAKNGRLVKRPFVLGEGCRLVGFKEDEWKKQF